MIGPDPPTLDQRGGNRKSQLYVYIYIEKDTLVSGLVASSAATLSITSRCTSAHSCPEKFCSNYAGGVRAQSFRSTVCGAGRHQPWQPFGPNVVYSWLIGSTSCAVKSFRSRRSSLRALSGRLTSTVRHHKFNKDSLATQGGFHPQQAILSRRLFMINTGAQ